MQPLPLRLPSKPQIAAAAQISGSQEAPVKDITIRGLEIRDTAYTYLGTDTADLHGMPSGGDCAHHPPI